jgi:hypothetical protein
MNKNLIFIIIGIVVLIGIFIGAQKCNNKKIIKDEIKVSSNDDSVKLLLMLHNKDLVQIHADSIERSKLVKRSDSLQVIANNVPTKYIPVYVALDTMSKESKIKLARTWLGNNIDSSGKLTDKGLQIIDSTKIQVNECQDELTATKKVVVAQKDIINQDTATIAKYKADEGVVNTTILKMTDTEKTLKNEIKTINHKISIKNIFSWTKDIVIGVGIVAVLILTHTIK